MALQPDVLHSCLQEAAKAARPALERCIEDAAAALQIAEAQSRRIAERDELATAWRELLTNKHAWSAQYPADLLTAFTSGMAAATQATLASPASLMPAQVGTSTHALMSADAFSLVDDADVSQAIELSRLLQQLLPLVEQPLAELDALISAVQGLPNVRPELNPLRPEVFADTLRTTISGTPAEPAITSLWLRYLAAPLGRELSLLYERLVTQLELAKIKGADYRVRQTPVSGGKGRGNNTPGPGPDSGNGGTRMAGPPPGGYVSDEPMAPRPSQYADLSDPEIKDNMFHDFLVNGGSNAHRGLAPAYYATIEEELVALKAARESALAPLTPPTGSRDTPQAGNPKVPAVDRPQRPVDERSQLNQAAWGSYSRPRERDILRTQLKKEARQVGQVLGLEVVHKLVAQVAQDSRLLAPVREAIVALEPSLLRLAMVDPRFFSDEGHAGRRLIERVAQRSFKYNDEFSPEFLAFFEPVASAFNALNDLAIDDAQPFGTALARLEHRWNEQDQLEASNRNSVLQTLRFAEERQTQADQIAFDLSSRSDLENVPRRVLDFLLGPWSLAMAHARLTDTRNQVDPLGFGSVVPDLLWSVKQEVTLQRPAKLIEMIPGLLGKLHTGLDLLGQDPHDNDAFFEMLMQLHQPVLKLRRLKSQRDASASDLMTLESGVMPLDAAPEEPPATPEQPRAEAAAPPWLGRDDLDAAGFEDTLPTDAADLTPLDQEEPSNVPSDGVETQSPASSASAPSGDAPAPEADTNLLITPAQAEQTLLSLQAGSWVDLYSRHRWLRAQLIWASTKGTLFMFVSHGGQPHSMTKRSCERLIRERLLRPVDSHSVVAQALDAVASQLAATAPTERETLSKT